MPREDQGDVSYHMPLFESLSSTASIVIELGCGHGNGSTRAFARGLQKSPAPREDKLLLSVDYDITRPDERPEAPFWCVIHGPSESRDTVQLAQFYLHRRWPDIIYVDTDHTYEQLSMELRTWSPVAGPDTLWLFHDTWMFGRYNSMVKAIEEWVELHPELEYTELTRECHGLGMMRSKT